MDKKDIFLVVLLLFAIYLWSLPVNNIPFGDVDSSVHFTSGDYMATFDKSITQLPSYMSYAITADTGGRFAYPPQFNAGEAIAQILGGQRIIPVYLFIVLLCSSVVLSVYFLIRKLYGFFPALLAAFLAIFSRRDIMYYLWGLWPQTIAFAFFPIVVYSYYKFIDLYDNKKERIKYILLTILFIGLQYTFHPQLLFFSLTFVFIYPLVLFIKDKRLPFKIKDFSLLIVLLVVLIIILAPLQLRTVLGNLGAINTGARTEGYSLKFDKIGGLFYWFKFYDDYLSSVPKPYFSYSYVYGGYWTFPLLILGFAFLVIRRKKQDYLMISWAITLYLFLHMDIIGGNRSFRFLQIEAQLFSSIIAIGLIGITSFIKLPEKQKNYLKYGLVLVFIIFGLFFNAKPVYSELKSSYQGITRMSEAEYNAALWVRENLPEDSLILLAGTVAYNKKKWFLGLSFRHILYDNQLITQEDADKATHVLLDYSDMVMIGRKDLIEQLQKWEKTFLANATSLYDEGYVKVYKLENR